MSDFSKDIERVINKTLGEIKTGNNEYDIGRVAGVEDFILKVIGLDDVMYYERVIVGEDDIGYVINVESNYVSVALLTRKHKIHVGEQVRQTKEPFKGSFSNDAVGRMVNIFGIDVLNDKQFEKLIPVEIETENISIMDRTPVNRPLHTGILGIDLLFPIGRGQRQLILGNSKTGKTQLCLDIIANQKDENIICIYVAIGKPKKEVKEIYYKLMQSGVMDRTIVIAAFNDDLPPVLALTPYYAISIANMYMKNIGKDVLVVIDDLRRHADAYREMSLLSEATMGRDAYPTDIFFFHSRLLEKGCQYKNGGSLTILPIVETKTSEITDYITTNIISITDGQIVLSEKYMQQGIKPAINYGLSVSRLGGNVQNADMKKMGAELRGQLLSYLESKEIYELANADQMSDSLKKKISDGQKIIDILKQPKWTNVTEVQAKEKYMSLQQQTESQQPQPQQPQSQPQQQPQMQPQAQPAQGGQNVQA